MLSVSPAPRRPANAPSRWRLPIVVLAVVLAHGAALYAAPQSGGGTDARPVLPAWHFSTTFVPHSVEAASTPTAAPPPVSVQPATPRRRDVMPKPAQAPVKHAQPAINSVANLIDTGSSPELPPSLPAPQDSLQIAAATPAPPAASVAREGSARSAPASPSRWVLPPPARLLYDVKGEVKGFPYQVNGELLWSTDNQTYHARMEIRHFLLGSRVQTSTGAIGPLGLEPTRFGDKVKSEVAAHFERDKGKVSFSANTPDAPLQPGAQDQLSVLVQVAAMVAGQGEALRPGQVLPFQAVGPRSSEAWKFTVGVTEALTLPGGAVQALRLWRDPVGEYDPKLEIWLSPELGYLPVRIRLTQRNGEFVDQQWRETRAP